ncbi:PREDICTED: nuclear receptor subfamily 0 group B member 2-like, partial [Phaethon lepturus]|uniref:nuclear receptor subfamily 0 group B member 2-like n=1 Tax=Phaethon lepturus TaxID=97097 RepID=UPI000530BA5E
MGRKGCSCTDRRRVVLKTPEATRRRTSKVLLNTLTFIRNLSSYHMPWEDQLVLSQQNWAPLVVLGMAQDFTSLADVQKMKNLLWKFWDRDVSAKEYAYIKGVILFNS